MRFLIKVGTVIKKSSLHEMETRRPLDRRTFATLQTVEPARILWQALEIHREFVKIFLLEKQPVRLAELKHCTSIQNSALKTKVSDLRTGLDNNSSKMC